MVVHARYRGELAVYRAAVAHTYDEGWCLRFVRTRYGIPFKTGIGTAMDAWRDLPPVAASLEHRQPAAGLPVLVVGRHRAAWPRRAEFGRWPSAVDGLAAGRADRQHLHPRYLDPVGDDAPRVGSRPERPVGVGAHGRPVVDHLGG